jgi:RelB Antitoxin alpha helical domain
MTYYQISQFIKIEEISIESRIIILLKVTKMLDITKNYVLDENQQPFAVQIPIAEFRKIEEILEDYGLAKLMEEVKGEDRLSKEEAVNYYALLKANNVES